MADLGTFDANTVEPTGAFELLPDGWYEAMIVESEMKPTAKKNGERLALTLQIVSGPYENRKLWDGLNLKNPSEKAVQIARRTLSAICRAVGVLTPKDSSELHNLPMLVKVGHGENENGEPWNEVNGYKAKEGPKPSLPPAAPPGGLAPWGKK